MLFNSAVFLFGFLPVCSGVFLLLRRRLPWLLVPWLLACSFVFYGWWSPRFLVLLLVSTLVNWGIARALVRARPEGRQLLVAGLAWNLGLLGWFKYTNFLIATADAITGFAIAPLDIVLPLGISFFTFQKIAYLVDVHDGRAEPGGLLDFMIFVFFFPQLIAGPIVHHSEMLPQFRGLSAHEPPGRGQAGPNLVLGGVVLLAGLFSKVVVADQLAPYANAVFDAARDGAAVGCLEAWQAALAYTGQLYFDFSGYSIMALGLGLLFGIRLPLNFNSPYQASSIIEFWRRWHITLSRFLKDYLYVPLGGNRKGPLRRHVNLMVVMVLGGLWHGAGWTFVIWGALHGVALVLAHLWRARMGDRMPALAGWLLTMLVVVVGWVFFRAASVPAALSILGAMSGVSAAAGNAMFTRTGLLASAAALAFAALAPNLQTLMGNFRIALEGGRGIGRLPAWVLWRPSFPWAGAAGAQIAAVLLASSTRSEFLYFQF